MTLRLHNTLTRTLEEFAPLTPTTVTMYVCGPTVYDDPHIGHARSAYVFDVLRRYLASKKFQVTFVRNVTDVDDKIIAKANDLGLPVTDVTQRYLTSYHEALHRLGIGEPTNEPKATEHVVPEMTDLIAKLLVNGVAYEAGGDVYFAVRKFEGYGRLSNRTPDELKAGARVEPGEQKHDPLDFALWKAAKPGEPSWTSPWGEGRPGWHIECSAMSTKYLGDRFDIHGGGVDLVFPHHENEIAQAQAAGKPFARYWVHNGLLTVNGEKMSKSLGNFVTVDEALKSCGRSADILKTFFLSAHYCSPIDYAQDNLKAAAKRFERWFTVFYEGRYQPDEYEPGIAVKEVDAIHEQFTSGMDDDLNTPKALAALDQLANLALQWHLELQHSSEEATTGRRLKSKIHAASDLLGKFGREIFGFTFEGRKDDDKVRKLANELLQQREEARRDGNYRLADGIRERIQNLGFSVKDTPKGPQLVRRRE